MKSTSCNEKLGDIMQLKNRHICHMTLELVYENCDIRTSGKYFLITLLLGLFFNRTC